MKGEGTRKESGEDEGKERGGRRKGKENGGGRERERGGMRRRRNGIMGGAVWEWMGKGIIIIILLYFT